MSDARAGMSHDDLRRLIVSRYGELSPVLQRIAEFAMDNPNEMALETVVAIAGRARVHPSALIRFAQSFGFSGFSDMQRVFQSRLTAQRLSYQQRIQRLAGDDGLLAGDTSHPGILLRTFAEAGKEALDHLAAETDRGMLEDAIALLAGAGTIYTVGHRRSFPIAAYLSYALSQVDRRVFLLDGVGGMLEQQARSMAAGDVLLATSFRPYAAETIGLVSATRERGVKVIAITDRLLSPLSRLGDIVLEVAEAEVMDFRSLMATFCLAQTLVVGLTRRLSAPADDKGEAPPADA